MEVTFFSTYFITTHYFTWNSGKLLICRHVFVYQKAFFLLAIFNYFFFLIVLSLSLEYLSVLNEISFVCLSYTMSLLSFLSDDWNMLYKFNISFENFHLFVALNKIRPFPEVKFSHESSEVNFLFLLYLRYVISRR